ncbi:hypothetical protein GF391_03935 [Candidatus Uhrbacteria bacterium]|nr:hypothetical protein [Candidatus Uhrbacteria bacterium]
MSTDYKERVNGYKVEHIWHNAACYDNKTGQPLKLEVYWKIRYDHLQVRISHRLLRKSAISQEEYEKLLHEFGVLDGPLFHQRKCLRYYEQEKIRKEMERLTPICPMCGNPMQMKHQESDALPFWECGGYRNSRCTGRLQISTEERMRWDRLWIALRQDRP